jgi:N-sulphoglucosamine sulphohydrolase, C-terminal
MTRQIPPLDAAMGKILDALGDRADNTLVFFLSDNGFMYGEHRLTDKNEPYEESVRVPFVVRFPGVLPPAGHFASDALVSNVDIAPTIMGAAGIPWEADGTSLLPILRGQKDSVREGLLIEWCEAGNVPNCRPEISVATGVSLPSFFGIETDRYVFVRYETGETELYDLQADPYEMTNLAADPAKSSLVDQLSSQLDALVAPPDTPGTTIVGGPVGIVPAGSVTFSFFSQARTTKFLCELSGPGQDGGRKPCDSGVLAYPSLGPGAYTFAVQAVDASGRQDPTPAAREFTVAS